MPTSNPTKTSDDMTASKVVLKKLRHLRRKLTGWILVQGVGKWLIALLAVLAFDMLLDRVFKMDYAQRLIMLVVMAGLAIAYFVWRVIRPLSSRPNDDALIYQVEAKNPELKENLISSWQLSREKDLASQGVSKELVEATIRSGIEKANQLNFGKALDVGQNRKNWLTLIAAIAATVLLGVGVAKTEFLSTWFNRNIMLLNDQWPQGTYLEIAGAKDGKLTLPRGADHRQVVTITEESTTQDVTVSIEVDNPGGRTVHQMKSTGKLDGREQVFVFHNVSSPFRFRASGGDDVTEWVDVKLVEPPSVIELAMQTFPPAYTGVSSVELTGNGPHAVLTGSGLQVGITANKSLSRAALKLGDETLEMQQIAEADADAEGADASKRYQLNIPAGELSGGEYEFQLIDQSGLANSRPSKFTVTIREDQPPKVRANLLGISGLVVPRAILPTQYSAADEFGLTQLSFDCHWKLGSEDAESVDQEMIFADFTNGTGGESEPNGPIKSVKDVAALDLLPLGLEPGTSFRFSVNAADSKPGTPGIGRSQEFLLRVVSDDELRSDLLRREIEQRKAFEQAYEVQMELATEIQAIAVREPDAGVTTEQFLAQQESDLITLVQSQKSIGTAIDRVADRFEEFLVEVKNNRLDEAENETFPEKRIERRFDEGIIQPIRKLDAELISIATRNLDNCRRSVNNAGELNEAVAQTKLIHDGIQDEMKRILDAMNDSENFQEIINDFLEIKEASIGIRKDIEKELKPKNIFDDNKGIFDK